MFVILVPILAPIIMGMALGIGNELLAVSPTIIDVETEELCTKDVAKIPMNKDTNGLAVNVINWLAKSPPMNLKEDPINLMLTRKI